MNTESSGRKALSFAENDEEVDHLGIDGSVTSERIDISTEIWYQDGTNVESSKLGAWMSETATESPAEVAVVSSLEGDSSPPPSVGLYTSDQAPRNDHWAHRFRRPRKRTISTLNLIVIPGSETATRLNIHTTIELSGGGIFSSDYTLDGELRLAIPQLTDK